MPFKIAQVYFFWATFYFLSFKEVCAQKNQPLDLRVVDGYDHSYYFVSTFIETHIQHHARLLKA